MRYQLSIGYKVNVEHQLINSNAKSIDDFFLYFGCGRHNKNLEPGRKEKISF